MTFVDFKGRQRLRRDKDDFGIGKGLWHQRIRTGTQKGSCE